MSEPESKKLEERLGEWLEEMSGYRPFQDDPRRALLVETMKALREKDAMIEFLRDAINGWKEGARAAEEERARLRARIADLHRSIPESDK